jgi:4-amino-4-deoxy-L-arabinose transferase-like glycosyltransferase
VELCGLGDLGLARTVKLCAVALAALTLLRLWIADTTALAPDEAYYWVWSHALAPGYPDHPPMVALWIRTGTSLLGDGALGVRLLGPLSVAIASLLLMDAADRLLPGRRAGERAAVMMNATLLFGVGAVIMTPDTPLLFFWTCCLWALARLMSGGSAPWWLAVGLFAGLAMTSKYTAVLLWFGIAAWLVVTPSQRFWLRRPMPWCGAALGLAVFLPVLLWNAAHDWASFARQGGRVDAWQPAKAARFLSELIAGQLGLVTPVIFVLCAAGIVLAVRQAWRTRDAAWTLLAALTLPAVVVFLQHALGDRVQGNWPAIIYPAAAIAAAGLQAPAWQRLYRPGVAIGLAITLLAYLQAGLGLLPLPVRLDPIALRLAGWDALAAGVEAARVQAGAGFVAADQYGVAAELARLLPPGVAVIGVEPRWALFNLAPATTANRTGILVRSARSGDADRTQWSSVTDLGRVDRKRGGDEVEAFRLYRVSGGADTLPAVMLPRADLAAAR